MRILAHISKRCLFARGRCRSDLIVVASLLLLNVLSFAETQASEGAAAFRCLDFSLSPEQRRKLEEQASHGDGEAAFRIGMSYDSENKELYQLWLRRAEDLGSENATWNLAFDDEHDRVLPNYKAAFERYKKLAIRGNLRAMNRVAEMLIEGYGTEKSLAEGLFWYEKVARAGKVFSMEKLANTLYKDEKYSDAFVWAEVGRLRYARLGQWKIKQMDTSKYSEKLTPTEIAEGKNRAKKLDTEIPFIEDWHNW